MLKLSANKLFLSAKEFFLVLPVVLLAVFFFFPQVSYATLITDNLVSYWSFDSNPNTIIGTNSMSGSVSGASQASGKLSNSYYFGGSSTITWSDVDITGSAWTIAAWVYHNSPVSGDYEVILTKGTDAGNPISMHGYCGPSGAYNGNCKALFWTTAGGTLLHQGTAGFQSSSAWHYQVATYDGAQGCLSIDGATQECWVKTGTLDTNSTSWTSGSFSNSINYMRGYIDELALWSRAITPTEITALYNSGTGRQIACDAGQYLVGITCTDVGAGYYSPQWDNSRYACAAGYYCSSATNSASTGNGQCTAGYYCPISSTSATQFACGVNMYCPAGSATATACPENSSTNGSLNAVSQLACHCNTDYYDMDGDTSGRSCSPVGAGYYSANYSDTRTACTNKPVNADYTGSGNGVNSCGFSCQGGLDASSNCASTATGISAIFSVGTTCFQSFTIQPDTAITIGSGATVNIGTSQDSLSVDPQGQVVVGTCGQ